MKKTVIFALASVLVMLFVAAAPVMASQPKNTYTFGAIGITTNPGNVFTSADKIEHATSQQSISLDFGHPWGDGVSTVQSSLQLNVDPNSQNYLHGNIVENLQTSYSTGTLELMTVAKLQGLGPYTYEGPTFTVTLPFYGTVTITNHQPFYGVLIQGVATTGHGTFSGENQKVKESITGVVIVTGNLAGLNVVSGTGTYMVVG